MAKKIKGIEESTIVAAAAIIGGYFLVVKPILQKLGIQKTAAEIQQEKLLTQADEQTRAQVYAKQKRTLTDAQLKSYADIIANSMDKSSTDDDYEKAGLYLCMVRNEADLYRLMEFFGKRDETYFGLFSYTKTLPQMVADNLSPQKIAAINKNYSSKGIAFRF